MREVVSTLSPDLIFALGRGDAGRYMEGVTGMPRRGNAAWNIRSSVPLVVPQHQVMCFAVPTPGLPMVRRYWDRLRSITMVAI